MTYIIENYSVLYVILLIVLMASLFLQIYLSKRDEGIYGLILPLLYFINSLRTMLDLLRFDINPVELFKILSFRNIPTIIFIVIYILGRKKLKRNKELEKMNIQDLK